MKIIEYLRGNPDLAVGGVFAVITSLVVPFEPRAMAMSVNYALLLLLFCLMALVQGLRESGVFSSFYQRVFHGAVSSRSLSRFFIFSCFFGSMLITNDVSLIIFVPLAITTLTEARCMGLFIPVVTWQTIAANMGSMLTPIGNPQNLFIYEHYTLSIVTFLSYTAPTVVVSGIVIYAATCSLPDKMVTLANENAEAHHISHGRVAMLTLLFVVCLLDVLRVIPPWLMALIVLPVIAVKSPHLFRAVDYKLLMLFVFLFIGVGNLTRVPEVSAFATRLLTGHEFIVSLILCQFISNVPATVMLAPYTDAAHELLLGVNIGGLGTIIASMASIISFKAYIKTRHSRTKKYLLVFTAANIGLLALLLVLYFVLDWK